MRVLFFKEISSFLNSLIGYVFIIIYLVSCGLFHFVIDSETTNLNLFSNAEANLIPFFGLSPWIFLMLIPAITMRSFAEEKRTGTIELLATKPISDLKIVLAKYLAGVALLIIAILPTLIYYFTIYELGKPVGSIDSGATFTSYLGLILIGSVFVAIGIFASTLTSSQIISFIVAMFLCWFFYDGFERLGTWATFKSFDYRIKYIGMTFHYEKIEKGVIYLRDIVYFLSLIVVFLFASLHIFRIKKS
ncbi:MAG: gliding motility-associated ABC transporter permease subunit GldF [Bacteroidetes bacterium]|nr:gliding motility-associated ABC transporter permease subunit GldF [Bacteroidota bacterium]